MDRTKAVILAGGKGSRLHPLTEKTPKPLIPLCGIPLIDFVLLNCLNSGIAITTIATQFQGNQLQEYVRERFDVVNPKLGRVIRFHQPTQEEGGAFQGSADALRKMMPFVQRHDEETDTLTVLAADHVYKMNYKQMLDFHYRHAGAITISTIPVP